MTVPCTHHARRPTPGDTFEAFSEPAVNRSKQFASLLRLALFMQRRAQRYQSFVFDRGNAKGDFHSYERSFIFL